MYYDPKTGRAYGSGVRNIWRASVESAGGEEQITQVELSYSFATSTGAVGHGTEDFTPQRLWKQLRLRLYLCSYDYEIGKRYHPQEQIVVAKNAEEARWIIQSEYYRQMDGYRRGKCKARYPFHLKAKRIKQVYMGSVS